MANKKITQLTASSVPLKAIDLVEGSINNGAGVYTSKKLTGQQVFDGVIESTPYISVYSTTNQTFVAQTATEITFNQTGVYNDLFLNGSSRINANKEGIYQFNLHI